MTVFFEIQTAIASCLPWQTLLSVWKNTPWLTIFSLDTVVLVLAIANHEKRPHNTTVSMALGVICINPIWEELGAKAAKASPSFHTLYRNQYN